jgi:hypothetical protein
VSARLDLAAIERAKRVPILDAVQRLGLRLKKVAAAELAGACPHCGGQDRFSVNTRKQVWNCRGCAKGGDVVSLVQHARGLDFLEAVAFLTGEDIRARPAQKPVPSVSKSETRASLTLAQIASVLGGEVTADRVRAPLPGRARQDRGLTVILNHDAPGGFATFSTESSDFKALRAYVRQRLENAAKTAAEAERRTETYVRDQIAAIQHEIVPPKGTPGERYLRETRDIDTAAIADVLERVDAIGWHPAVYFNQEGHELHGKRLGCLVGVMTDPVTAAPTGGISRTYVHEGRKVTKAKTLGPGGIVRLSADEDVLGGLHIGEGLETCLYVMGLGFRPMWSTGGTAMMTGFPVLGGIEALTIIADNDVNDAGEKAARAAEARWLEAGREVLIHIPNERGDVNDAARGNLRWPKCRPKTG